MASVHIYDRAELLAKLRLVAPALSKSDRHPQLQMVHFSEFGLLAYNDRIALATPLEGPPIGVNGEQLIKFLATATDPQVQFTLADNGVLQLDAHGFSASLHTHPAPPFRWPSLDDVPCVYIDKPLAAALKLTQKIVIETSPKPQAAGVTFIRDDAGVVLYATDSKTLLAQSLEEAAAPPPELSAPVIAVLSMPCVEQLVKLAPGWLRFAADHVQFDSDDGTVSLWARLILPQEWVDFTSVVEERKPAELHVLPEGFAALVARAGVLAVKNKKDRKRCRMHLDGSHLEVVSSGPGGQLTDRLDFEHTPLSVVFDQIVMERLGNQGLSLLGVGPRALHMATPDERISYMMATLNERD